MILERLESGDDGAEETQRLINEFVTKVQPVLKEEWRRVKRGELSYRVLKWGSVIAVLIAIAFSVGYFGSMAGFWHK